MDKKNLKLYTLFISFIFKNKLTKGKDNNERKENCI